MLSCDCDFDKSDFDSWYMNPDDFSTLCSTRRKRCVSCAQLIDVGTTILEFECYRRPYNRIEERCKGEEIRTASSYMCEECGDIFMNLIAVGFCLNIYEGSMQCALQEYHELTGFTPKEGQHG